MADRRLWTTEEDDYIMKLVVRYGTKKWPLISQKLCQETQYERTGKQCRERWYNHLNPEINTTKWSQEDQQKLFESHKEFGNRWKQISKLFIGRTDNSIKNHFYSTIRRCLRRINKLQGEKNSTLKMRSLKPYVLSKILADRNLTEVILDLGKIKPNKSNIDARGGYMQEFNTMINKLYQINEEYEKVKGMRKIQKNNEGNQGEESQEIDLESQGQNQGVKIQEMSSQQQQRYEIKEKIKENKYLAEEQGSESPKKIKMQSKKTILVSPVKASDLMPCLPVYYHPQKRSRKQLNYHKLNEGILCESQRQEVIDETNHSLLSRRGVIEQIQNDHHEQEMLQEIIEEQQKQNEKDQYINKNIFAHDFMEIRGFNQIDIAQPSPSFGKSHPSFQDLIVVGTHVRIHQSPGYGDREYQLARKQSQEEFIEQILQINFDPEAVLKELPEEQSQN